jgi:hypothetical protein
MSGAMPGSPIGDTWLLWFRAGAQRFDVDDLVTTRAPIWRRLPGICSRKSYLDKINHIVL